MRRNILLVDDDPHILELVTFFLEQGGFVVRTKPDGFSAVSELEANDYDLLILDLIMPHMNGLKALKKIRASEKLKDLPVIILTASQDVENVQKARALKVSDYIVKPPKRDDLLKRIERILGGRPQYDELRFQPEDPEAQGIISLPIKLKSVSKSGLILEGAAEIPKKSIISTVDLPIFKDLQIDLGLLEVTDCTLNENKKYDYFMTLLDLPQEASQRLGEWIITETLKRKAG